jgi:hypothetical protein
MNKNFKTCSKCNEEKTYLEFNKDKSRKDGHCYLCRDCQNKQTANSYYKHKANRRSGRRIYEKKLRENNAEFKIKNNLSRRMRKALNGFSKSTNTMELIGCNINKLKIHLQNTAIKNGYYNFDIENYSGKDYHIDHIIPCKAFRLEIIENQKKCFNYKNLQILDSKANIVKSNKIYNL